MKTLRHFTSLFGPFRVIKSLIVHVIGQLLLSEIHKFKKTVSRDIPRKQLTSFITGFYPTIFAFEFSRPCFLKQFCDFFSTIERNSILLVGEMSVADTENE